MRSKPKNKTRLKQLRLILLLALVSSGLVYAAVKLIAGPTTVLYPTQQKDDQASVYDIRARQLQSVTVTPDSPAADLRDFASWLNQHQVEGFIGEVGWPPDSYWQAQASEWLNVAQAAELPVTVWAAGHKWPQNYPLVFFADSNQDGILNTNQSQAKLLLDHPLANKVDWGVNVAGLEFGANTPQFSNQSPGQLDTNFFEEPSPSYAYLAKQGVKVLRLPFSWERLQPEPYGELNVGYLQLIQNSVNSANQNNIKIILDLHNYGHYKFADGEQPLGSDRLSYDALEDIWLRLNQIFKDEPAIYAYDIMNEPRGLPAVDQPTPAKQWEAGTQDLLDALREDGFKGTVLIPGYEWSKLQRWAANHPTAWITDPANNFRYTAHHYWDTDQTGTYK